MLPTESSDSCRVPATHHLRKIVIVMTMIIIKAVIFIALYIADMGEHTQLNKTNKAVCIPQK